MFNSKSFHDVRFPIDLAIGSTGGPERRTEIITLGSGHEQRNTRWAHSRRRYNAGYGVKTVADLQTVIEFFEQRRGRLYGFRFRDPLDWKSSRGNIPASQVDQQIGIGDGSADTFQIVKNYGQGVSQYTRPIAKPVETSVLVSVDGVGLSPSQYGIDAQTGAITFVTGSIPETGQVIAAGFEFDVPVRFDADEISINLGHFEAGDIPSIPLVELLP